MKRKHAAISKDKKNRNQDDDEKHLKYRVPDTEYFKSIVLIVARWKLPEVLAKMIDEWLYASDGYLIRAHVGHLEKYCMDHEYKALNAILYGPESLLIISGLNFDQGINVIAYLAMAHRSINESDLVVIRYYTRPRSGITPLRCFERIFEDHVISFQHEERRMEFYNRGKVILKFIVSAARFEIDPDLYKSDYLVHHIDDIVTVRRPIFSKRKVNKK